MNRSTDLDDLKRIMLDPGRYKTFQNGRMNSTLSAERLVPPASPEVRQIPLTGKPVLQLETSNAQSKPDSGLKNLAMFSRWGAWAGLNLIFAEQPDASATNLSRRAIQTQRLAVAGICGGVGTTSITASLARIAAQRGQRPLLLDPHAFSILPLYFGSSGTRLPLSTIIMQGDPAGSAIHFCRRTEAFNGRSIADWVVRSLASLSNESDGFLIDTGLLPPDGFLTELGRDTIRLVVVTPEIRCLARLAELGYYEDESWSSIESARPVLLLNQFDTSDPLHVEIRSRLASRFGERLLPLVIRSDRSISAALADGVTVLDHNPDSAIAQDLQELYEWLLQHRTRMNSIDIRHKVEAQ